MNYETIKNMPRTRDGKMLYGIFAAFVARAMLNQAVTLFATNSDGALMAFLMTGLLVYTIILAIVRYDTGRPLFEPLKR